MRRLLNVWALSVLCSTTILLAQEDITAIPFDSVPAGVEVVAGSAGASIGLGANTNVSGELRASGIVSTSQGFAYPDGSIQTTAGASGAGLTANQGQYSNTIADFSPPNPFTEVCLKNGSLMSDIHGVGEPTAGGNCQPGDIGWIIERFQRDAGATISWNKARIECLKSGMRLPEPFEWQVACEDSSLAMADMEDGWEWSGNALFPLRIESSQPNRNGMTAFMLGNGSCVHGSNGTVARSDAGTTLGQVRCAR